MYRATNLNPSSYDIKVELSGFRTVLQRDVAVSVSETLNIVFKLEIDTIQETVVVSGQAALLNTTNSEVGTTIEARKVVDLPINSRDFSRLALFTPAAKITSPHGIIRDSTPDSTGRAVRLLGLLERRPFPSRSPCQAGQLPFEAGMAAAYGLDRTEALKAITIYPAQILGIADRYGSLEKGKVADVVVAEGLILQPRAKVTRVFIRGRQIELKTWQEELYEKYAPRPRPTPSALR